MSLLLVLLFDIAIVLTVVVAIKWRNKKREKYRDVYENGDYDCEDGAR